MTVHKFNDGGVLYTGEDALRMMRSPRDRYDVSCSFCIHEGDAEYCDGCSVPNSESGCSCHISAPCSYCVDSKFEVSPYLLNYKHYKKTDSGRWRWECIRGDQETLEALKRIEAAGYNLAAETLTTGEISITVEDSEADHDIVLCAKTDFLTNLTKLIVRFARTL